MHESKRNMFLAALRVELLSFIRSKKAVTYIGILASLFLIANLGEFLLGSASVPSLTVLNFNLYASIVFTAYMFLSVISSYPDDLRRGRLTAPILMGQKAINVMFSKLIIEVLLPIGFLTIFGIINVGLNCLIHMQFSWNLLLSVLSLVLAELFVGSVALSISCLVKNTTLGVVCMVGVVIVDSAFLRLLSAADTFPSALFQYANYLILPISDNRVILYVAVMAAIAALFIVIAAQILDDRQDVTI